MSLARYEPADAGVPDEAGSARFSAIGVARFCADALRSVRLEEVDVEARRHESLDGLEQHHETHRRPDVKVNRIAALLQVCCPSHRVLAGQMLDQADPLVVMPPARVGRAAAIIAQQVRDRRGRTPGVERGPAIRHGQQQHPARAQDAQRVPQTAHRVLEVLDDVARDDEVE